MSSAFSFFWGSRRSFSSEAATALRNETAPEGAVCFSDSGFRFPREPKPDDYGAEEQDQERARLGDIGRRRGLGRGRLRIAVVARRVRIVDAGRRRGDGSGDRRHDQNRGRTPAAGRREIISFLRRKSGSGNRRRRRHFSQLRFIRPPRFERKAGDISGDPSGSGAGS